MTRLHLLAALWMSMKIVGVVNGLVVDVFVMVVLAQASEARKVCLTQSR